MGDCRIRIVIAKRLFNSLPDDLTKYYDGNDASARVAVNEKSISFVRMHSADTTVREVVDQNVLLRRLYFGNDSSSLPLSKGIEISAEATSEFALWDCTLNPPRDITSWPIQEYPDLQGFKSKTLHAAGSFPSGTWTAIPKGIAPNIFSDYDSNADVDVQYNSSRGNMDNNADATNSTDASRRVEFSNPALRIGSSKSGALLPSQVMETVSNRFAAEEQEEERNRMETSEASSIALRRGNLQRRAQKEAERASKLDQRIAMLEEQSSNKASKKQKISDQVLRMLVKSRATGDKNLKELDRLYFQCLNLVDDSNGDSNESETSPDDGSSKQYRYFSPQDTFAKITNSFFNGRQKENKEFFSEVLCRRSIGQTEETSEELPVYGRFPMTMRVYEAQSEGYLSLSKNISNYFDDMLIIRWYKDREEATPLIQDIAVLDINDQNDTTEKTVSGSIDQVMLADATTLPAFIPTAAGEKTETANNDTDTTSIFEDAQLSNDIQEMDDANRKGIKKGTSAKKSAAALKVRQMKMKSKAKGNKKLKIEERSFLEVVSISEIGKKPVCGYYFLSRNDPIERILQIIGSDSFSKSKTSDWEFLVSQDDSRYRPIGATSIRMKEAVEQEILKSFDRIILRPKAN